MLADCRSSDMWHDELCLMWQVMQVSIAASRLPYRAEVFTGFPGEPEENSYLQNNPGQLVPASRMQSV